MNVFDLFAKISLDTSGYEKDLKGAQSSFTKFGDGLKSAAGKVGDVLAGIGKTAAVGIGAAGTALTALTKQSLDAVANFEQLEGGVKKIFGEESARKVIDYAEKAYSTAGMSANQYMETVTNFSATLIAGLKGDTETAADLANTAIEDMADNANTFGTNIESVQAAYQAFAKQNYTLLDNLKLGYGGTAREMARLLNESGVLGDRLINLDDTKGLTEAISEAGFPKIIEAIHKVQQELSITGTTGDEAGKTISGSVASMKAAWQNFLTGTGSPAQFTEVLKNSIGNIKNNLNDIIPRLTDGLTALVDQIAPELPLIIEDTLPAIITGASSLLEGLANRLPQLITTILPALSKGVVDVSVALVGVMPQLVSSLAQSIPIVVRTIMSKKDELLKAGKDMIAALTPKDFKGLVNQGSEAVKNLIDGALSPESINTLLDGAGKIIENLVDGIKTVLLGGEQDGEGGIFGAAKEIIIKIGEYFSDAKNRQAFADGAFNLLKSLGSAIVTVIQNGVAPLMVEAARAWMECFIGAVDYTDAASDIIKRLGEAFLHNMMTGGIIGKWIDDASEKYLEENGYNDLPSYDDTPIMEAIGMRNSGHVPDNMGEEYLMRYAGRNYGAPSYAAPTALPNTSYGDNNVSITINTTSDRPDEIGYAVSDAVDQSLAKLQAQKNRGYGYAN